MNRRTRSIVARLLAGAIAALEVAPPAAALPPEKEVWRRVDTQNFTLFGNVSARQLVEAGRRLEGLQQVLAKTTRGLSERSPLPTHAYVFRSTASFDPYRLGEDGKPRSLSGYFVQSPEGNYVTMDASGSETPYRIIFHEYLHYVLANNVPNLPVWLNEGLAEFYSTVQVWPDGTTVQIGLPIPEHLAELRRGTLLPMARLFAIDQDSPEYNESARQGVFYAQSWALTHWFIAADESRRARLMEYLNRLKKGEEGEGVFQAAIGIAPEVLEEALRKYTRQSSFDYFLFSLGEAVEKTDADARPISRAETLFRLGDLLAHVAPIRYDDAEAHLRAALALEPDHVETLLTRAWLERTRKRWDKAAASYEAALAKGGARARTQYGSMLLERLYAEDASVDPERTPEAALRARELFRQALAEHPDDALSLAGLGTSFAFEAAASDPSEGMAALARAHELMPSRKDLLVGWIALAARAGQTEAAYSRLERGLRGKAESALVHAAEEAIAYAEWNRAARALEAGRGEEAKQILEAARTRIQDPQVRAMLEEHKAKLGSIAASRETIGLYNEAIEAARQQDWSKARELFDRVASSADDPALRQAAESASQEVARTETRSRIVDRYNAAIELANQGDLHGAITALEKLLADEKEWGPEERARVEKTLGDLKGARRDGR